MGAQQAIYVRVSHAPAVFGVDRSTIYRWAAAGHVRIYKRGRMSWVKAAEVSEFIENSSGE